MIAFPGVPYLEQFALYSAIMADKIEFLYDNRNLIKKITFRKSLAILVILCGLFAVE